MPRLLAFGLLLCAACSSTRAPEGDPRLYFAVEVRRAGHVVAQPKLLGEVGKKVRAERRQPGAAEADYRLALSTAPQGETYQVVVDLALPGAEAHSEARLLHGEVRRLDLSPNPGNLEVTLMLMKVDSLEFRTLMNLSEQSEHPSPPPSI